MRTLLVAASGALVWLALRASAGATGLLLAALASVLVARALGVDLGSPRPRHGWTSATAGAVWFLAVFAVEVVLTAGQQLRLVLAPRLRLRPRWVRMELELEGPVLRAVLAAAVSLTPGTLACDLRGRTLWIHALDAGSDGEVTQRLRRRLEAPLRRLEAR